MPDLYLIYRHIKMQIIKYMCKLTRKGTSCKVSLLPLQAVIFYKVIGIFTLLTPKKYICTIIKCLTETVICNVHKDILSNYLLMSD